MRRPAWGQHVQKAGAWTLWIASRRQAPCPDVQHVSVLHPTHHDQHTLPSQAFTPSFLLCCLLKYSRVSLEHLKWCSAHVGSGCLVIRNCRHDLQCCCTD